MQSKTLLFNPPFFKKNMVGFMAIPIVYLVSLLLWMPLTLFVEISAALSYNNVEIDRIGPMFVSQMAGFTHPFPVALFAIAAVVTVYYYLSNTKHTYMIHALPVTRLSLFITNTVSALTMLVIPQCIVTIFVALQICSFGYSNLVWIVFLWFLTQMLMDILFIGMASLAVMFTGQLITGAFFFGVFNCIYLIVINTVRIASALLVFGSAPLDLTPGIKWFTPLYALWRTNGNVFQYGTFDIIGDYDGSYYVADLADAFISTRDAWLTLGIYAIVGIVLLVLAFLCYKKRQLEVARSFLSFKWLGYIFRWGVAFVISVLSSFVISAIANLGYIIGGTNRTFLTMLFTSLIVGAIVFMIAEFIVKKSVHIWKKNFFIEWGAFVAVMVIFVIAMFGIGGSVQNHVPEKNDIETISFSMDGNGVYNYTGITDSENTVDSVRELHEAVIDIIPELKAHDYNFYGDYLNLSFYYNRKNGDRVSREYRIPTSDNNPRINEAIAKIYDVINEYQYVSGTVLMEGTDYSPVQVEVEVTNDTAYSDWFYMEYDNVIELYEAYKKDIEEGNIRYYNENDEKKIRFNMYFVEHADKMSSEAWTRMIQMHEVYNGENDVRYNVIRLNSNCKHSAEVLMDAGIITDASKLDEVDTYRFPDALPEAVEEF